MPLAVPDGLLRVQFIPTIASPTLAPTIAEFTAGTDISKGISAAPEGFTAETTFVEAPNLLTVVTPKVAGRLNIPDSALNMYWADATGSRSRSVPGRRRWRTSVPSSVTGSASRSRTRSPRTSRFSPEPHGSSFWERGPLLSRVAALLPVS
jgi:hypothetical protein